MKKQAGALGDINQARDEIVQVKSEFVKEQTQALKHITDTADAVNDAKSDINKNKEQLVEAQAHQEKLRADVRDEMTKSNKLMGDAISEQLNSLKGEQSKFITEHKDHIASQANNLKQMNEDQKDNMKALLDENSQNKEVLTKGIKENKDAIEKDLHETKKNINDELFKMRNNQEANIESMRTEQVKSVEKVLDTHRHVLTDTHQLVNEQMKTSSALNREQQTSSALAREVTNNALLREKALDQQGADRFQAETEMRSQTTEIIKNLANQTAQQTEMVKNMANESAQTTEQMKALTDQTTDFMKDMKNITTESSEQVKNLTSETSDLMKEVKKAEQPLASDIQADALRAKLSERSAVDELREKLGLAPKAPAPVEQGIKQTSIMQVATPVETSSFMPGSINMNSGKKNVDGEAEKAVPLVAGEQEQAGEQQSSTGADLSSMLASSNIGEQSVIVDPGSDEEYEKPGSMIVANHATRNSQQLLDKRAAPMANLLESRGAPMNNLMDSKAAPFMDAEMQMGMTSELLQME
jgi:myosin heavy subunit